MLTSPPPLVAAILQDAAILIMQVGYPADFEERIDLFLEWWEIEVVEIPIPDSPPITVWQGASLFWIEMLAYGVVNPNWRFWSSIERDFNES